VNDMMDVIDILIILINKIIKLQIYLYD